MASSGSELRNQVQIGVFPRVPWPVPFLQNRMRSQGIWLLVQGFPPAFLLFGFQGRIRGRGLWGWRWRQQDMADASRPAFLLPQLTVFSNTKEAWEWHTHSPDQYNEFSISAYIMALCMKQPFFLSQFMLAVHSQPVPSTPREKKNPALKKNDENTKWNSNSNEICVKL